MCTNSEPTHQMFIGILLSNIKIKKSGLEITIIDSFNKVPITIQFVNQWLMFDCIRGRYPLPDLKSLYVLFNQVPYNKQLC